MEQRSYFGLSEHLEKLSRHGDPLEIFKATVDFEYFRGWLVERLGYGDGSKGGRSPFDPVSMFKALILQAQHNLSDARMEFMIRDRRSWMRFLDFDFGGPTPDENTIRLFRNELTVKRVMKAFDWQLQKTPKAWPPNTTSEPTSYSSPSSSSPPASGSGVMSQRPSSRRRPLPCPLALAICTIVH